MRLTLVRHATLVLETGVGRVLVDPMLRTAGTTPPIENTPNQRRRPLHRHPSARRSFDDLVPHDIPIVTQPESADEPRQRGYRNVHTEHPALTMMRGRHGRDTGDTVWCDEAQQALDEHEPHTVVVNGGRAHFLGGAPIVMDADDVRRAPEATDARVTVVHLEAINHCVEPRSAYRAIPGVLVPDDGDSF